MSRKGRRRIAEAKAWAIRARVVRGIGIGRRREFEESLEAAVLRDIHCLSWISLVHGRLQREIATMANVFPDSSRLTDFVCEDCGSPLVHHIKQGEWVYDFFGCSSCLDGCTALYDNQNGKPVWKA